MAKRGIFIGATGQNVGKTTICLGLISVFKKKIPQLGFMKPVGQRFERVENGLQVDKDVTLFKEYFSLPQGYEEMSPVIFTSGLTREILDQKMEPSFLKKKILSSYLKISESSEFTIVEGTGHVAVGSLAGISNAEVARLLGLEMILIVKGGIGSSFDELALNKALLDRIGVKLKGVILNQVFDEKREMVINYMTKALKQWGVPLLGSIPFNQLLSTPSMADFEILFNTSLLSGEAYRLSHFESIRLVATSLETFREVIFPGQLIVTPATREDIILALLESPPKDHGLILTGRHPPTPFIVEKLKRSQMPSLYAPLSTFDAMKMVTSNIAKIQKKDLSKVQKAIQLVESFLDFSVLY